MEFRQVLGDCTKWQPQQVSDHWLFLFSAEQQQICSSSNLKDMHEASDTKYLQDLLTSYVH